MSKKIVLSQDAPAPIGPYSQAVAANGMLFVSGQIPLDAQGNMVGEGDVVAQTHQVMKNLKAVLTAGGTSLDKVVRCTIFIKDMNDFPKINEAYGEYFPKDPPSRACVEVARLPKDVLVEIDGLALV